jgi:hypothetical protein
VWIAREVAWWLAHRRTDHILILLTEGEVVWDQQMNDFAWPRTDALPAQLEHRFAEEPLYVDVRWARGLDQLSIRHLKFRGAVLDIVATLMGRDKDELDSEDIRQHRRTMRLAWSSVVSLCLLTLLSVSATWFALTQRNEAIRQRDLAVLERLATQAAYKEVRKEYEKLSAIYKEKLDEVSVPLPKIR